VRRLLESLPYPERTPFLGQVLVDRTGAIWVGACRVPDATSSRFLVFNPTGQLLEDMQLPFVMDLLDANGERALGRRHDELGVQSLVVLRRRCITTG